MIKHDIPGKVVLLGTPGGRPQNRQRDTSSWNLLSTLAEEGGAGKVFMLNAGAYDTMDACIMCV